MKIKKRNIKKRSFTYIFSNKKKNKKSLSKTEINKKKSLLTIYKNTKLKASRLKFVGTMVLNTQKQDNTILNGTFLITIPT